MNILPFTAPQDFKSAIHPSEEKDAYWFIFSSDQLLVSEDKKGLPTQNDFLLQRILYIGTLKDKNLFAGEVENGMEPPCGWRWSPLRPLYGMLNHDLYAIAGHSLQLIQWDRTNKYCGRCGNTTFSCEFERCRECSACGLLAYPKFSVAVLALVKRDKQILLARSPQFSEPFYSVIAGFVDLGETLEQCVYREVLEEVGIKVKNIRFFCSQPWPFSYSLMVGFVCEWQEGEIKIDPAEIEDAGWFDSSSLPQLPPIYSLSRILIDHFTKEL